MSEQSNNGDDYDVEFEHALEQFLNELELNAAANPKTLIAAFPNRESEIHGVLSGMRLPERATLGADPPVPSGLQLEALLRKPASARADVLSATPVAGTQESSVDGSNEHAGAGAQSTWQNSSPNGRGNDGIAGAQLQSFGDFQLIEVLDSGGMGIVYRARQTKPIQRDVALKVIKTESGGADLLARFAVEGKSLAMMSHPNIATVLAWGATDADRPYLVMELVDGTDIASFCTQHDLGLAERLRIFHQVCLGIQHAHQRGVLHRDIKPSNILVTLVDGQPTPKIIDFGLAKEFGDEAEQHTAHTQLGQILGTLHYMSPEAAKLQSSLVDTRSDVFSLGVVLFELLTGTTPLYDQLGLEVPIDERLRRVRRQLLVRPSDRVRGPARRKVVGDLDAICCKALAADPSERYASAAALAEDIERYLSNRPVLAAQATGLRQYVRFLKHHWKAAGLVAAIACFLLVAVGVSTWWAYRATVAEKAMTRSLAASEAAAFAETEARRDAETARATTVAINQFLVKDVFALADPMIAESADLTMREAIKMAVVALDHRFEGRPAVEAEVRRVIAEVLIDTGEYQSSKKELARVLPVFEELYGEADLRTIYARQQLAMAHYYLADLQVCEALIDQNDALLAAYPSTDLEARKYKWLLAADRALLLQKRGSGDQAIDLLKSLISEVRRENPEDFDHLDELRRNLSQMLSSHGRILEATELAEELVADSLQRHGPEDPVTVQQKLTWLSGLLELGRIEEAAADIESLAAVASESLGGTHPISLRARRLRLRYLTEVGDFEASAREARSLIDFGQTNIDFDYPSLAKDLERLTTALIELDRQQEAIDALQTEVDRQRQLKGRDNPFTQGLEQQLAGLYIKLGRRDEATKLLAEVPEFLLDDSDESRMRIPTPDEVRMAWNWSFNAVGMREYEQLLKVADNVRSRLPTDDPRYARDLSIARFLCGLAHEKLGNFQQAVPFLQSAASGPITEGIEQAAIFDALTRCLVGLKRYDEAFQVGLEHLQMTVRSRGGDAQRSDDAWKDLLEIVDAVEDTSGDAATASMYEQLSQVGIEQFGSSDARTISVQNQWGLAIKDRTRTIEIFRRAIESAGPATDENRAKIAPLNYNLGLALERTKQWADAEIVWRTAVAELEELYRPNYYRALRAKDHLTEALHELQRFDESANCLAKALSFDRRSTDKDVEVQMLLAKKLEQMLTDNLCSAEVHKRLSELLQEAIRSAATCKSVETFEFVRLCKVGSLASSLDGDTELAISHLSAALSRLDSDNPTGLSAAQEWMQCGDAAGKLGYPDVAQSAWRKARQAISDIGIESVELNQLELELANRMQEPTAADAP